MTLLPQQHINSVRKILTITHDTNGWIAFVSEIKVLTHGVRYKMGSCAKAAYSRTEQITRNPIFLYFCTADL